MSVVAKVAHLSYCWALVSVAAPRAWNWLLTDPKLQTHFVENLIHFVWVCVRAPGNMVIWLHFAWVVDDAKRIVVTRVCVSVRGRMPTLLHGPGCNLGSGRGCALVVHYWADLQSGHTTSALNSLTLRLQAANGIDLSRVHVCCIRENLCSRYC